MKYFERKRDAINFMDNSNDQYLILFQEDISRKGHKKFMVCKTDDIYSRIDYNKKKEISSHYYESWERDTQVCFALDIDIPLNEKEKRRIDFNKILRDDIRSVKYYAKKFYDHVYKYEDIIILKTTDQNSKLSAHVIFRGLSIEKISDSKKF